MAPIPTMKTRIRAALCIAAVTNVRAVGDARHRASTPRSTRLSRKFTVEYCEQRLRENPWPTAALYGKVQVLLAKEK